MADKTPVVRSRLYSSGKLLDFRSDRIARDMTGPASSAYGPATSDQRPSPVHLSEN
jgi:hypothetical protein